MLKVDLYNFDGKKKETISLSGERGGKPNIDLLSQAVHVYEDRLHLGLAKAKTRGEVRISTRKIYRQKGTGGARHGAKSAPIFVGGGVTHGPKGFKRILVLSKSQKNRALEEAFHQKILEGKVVAVTGLEKMKKTKDAAIFIKNLIGDKVTMQRSMQIVLSDKNNDLSRLFRNIEGVKVNYMKDLNAYKIFLSGMVIVDKDVVSKIFRKKDAKVNADKSIGQKMEKKVEKKKIKLTVKGKEVKTKLQKTTKSNLKSKK